MRRKEELIVRLLWPLKLKLLKLYHDGVIRRHTPILVAYRKLTSVFYWPKMEKDIRQYIKRM